jgi:hypothetical protein
MLRKLHKQYCPDAKEPWWRAIPDEAGAAAAASGDPVVDYHSAQRDAAAEQVDPETYAQGRETYLKDTGRKPPAAGE